MPAMGPPAEVTSLVRSPRPRGQVKAPGSQTRLLWARPLLGSLYKVAGERLGH